MKTKSSQGKPIGILHVVWSLWMGGAEKLACDLVRTLPTDRFRPIICSIVHDGILGDELRAEGYQVYHRHSSPGLDFKTVKWLREIIQREQIQVVHAHQYNPMTYAVLATAGMRGVKVVFTEHGRLYPEKWSWKRYLLNPLLALGVDQFVSIAECTKQAMVRYDNFPARRIKVIHNGVDFDSIRTEVDLSVKRRELGINETDRIIGTAARLEGIKNLPMMLRAFKRVLGAQPDALLLIAGTGSEEGSLKSLASEMGIADRVRFLGLRFDLAEIYPLFEVFLLTSYTEGISITLLEAMANGVPAVVTNVGGNSEVVINGDTGMLVSSDDDSDLAAKILVLLNSPERAQWMGERALERVVTDFSFQIMMDNYSVLYEL